MQKNELDSQLQDKKNEIKYVSQEIINANARTSTKFNELVGSSLSKYIEARKDTAPIIVDSVSEFDDSNNQIDLSSYINSKVMLEVRNTDPEVQIIANGIYQKEASMIENIVNELQVACHNEYYSGADFWENLEGVLNLEKEEFCGKSPRNIPLTNRSYIEQKHIHMAKTLAAYQLSLDPSKNIRGEQLLVLMDIFKVLVKVSQ